MSDDLVKRLRDRGVCSPAHNSCRNDFICEQAADRIEELETKLSEQEALLAKAVEALEFWLQAQEPDVDAAIDLMQATLAELKNPEDSMKGDSDE